MWLEFHRPPLLLTPHSTTHCSQVHPLANPNSNPICLLTILPGCPSLPSIYDRWLFNALAFQLSPAETLVIASWLVDKYSTHCFWASGAAPIPLLDKSHKLPRHEFRFVHNLTFPIAIPCRLIKNWKPPNYSPNGAAGPVSFVARISQCLAVSHPEHTAESPDREHVTASITTAASNKIVAKPRDVIGIFESKQEFNRHTGPEDERAPPPCLWIRYI